MYENLRPPRADSAIPPASIKHFERRGWIAQVKKNGTNNVIVVDPQKRVTAHNRMGEPHKSWSFTDETSTFFRNLPGDGHWVLNAELIHAKVKGIRNVNYVHDVLVANGRELWGTTFEYRQKVLMSVSGGSHNPSSLFATHDVIDDHTWVAVNYVEELSDLYWSLTEPEDEGIVLKSPHGIYLQGDSRHAPWMVKCRKTTKNFCF